MKKIFTLLALGAMTLGANAQKTVQGAGFWDNWSIGLVGGGVAPLINSDYIKDARGLYGLDVTKQITPIYGMGVQVLGAHNVTPSSNVYDVMSVSLLGKFNLSNAFCGYNGKPRVFEVEAVAAAGWGHAFFPTAEGPDQDFMTSKFGLNLNFNLGKQKAWTLSLMPAVAYNLSTPEQNANPSYNINQSAFELMTGVTYHFKNSNNGRHYMTFQKAYDQAEVDGLNAKVNDLRAQVNDKEAEVAKLNENVKALQQEVNELRNRGPIVQTQTITQTITKSTNSLEQTVTFRQGKSVVDASQLPNVERVATFLRNHAKATVSIKGYASPEGSAEVNARIALARAEAVKKILVNKYKIAANRITAEGQGVGNMFSEADWNRVSICTIEEAE